MTKSFNKKKIIIFLGSLILAILIIVLFLPADQGGKKTLIKGTATWPLYSFETATDKAATIVYGKIMDKRKTQVHETVNSSGGIFREYYREVTVELIEVLKGDIKRKKITYLEPGGETSDVISVVSGVEEVSVGEEYIFFLNPYGAFLSPMTLIPVQDGTVLIDGKICPDELLNQQTRSGGVNVDQYISAIKNEVESN